LPCIFPYLSFAFLTFPTCFSVPAILLDCADSFSIPQSSFILLIYFAHFSYSDRPSSQITS
ncbi:hypothetical protein OQ486_16110, partial [Plesiomonas shigelloides]|uniref:hypothetical protein n=1 Tax=Plesiomonas shigelloides TaxID=703 RepID=UPI002248381B